jgi:hypothetical protein
MRRRKHESIEHEVEWRVATVDGAVVVWTDQYEVRKSIVASAAEQRQLSFTLTPLFFPGKVGTGFPQEMRPA